MSTTSWQIGTNYHDTNPFMKNTSNSSYGQWFGGSGGSTPVTPNAPSYGSLGPRSGRKLLGYNTTPANKYSTVTSRDVHNIVSSGGNNDPKDKFSSFISRYGSGKVTPVSDSEKIMALENDSQPIRQHMQPPMNSAELADDLGVSDLKLSPRAVGTLSSLSITSPSRSNSLPSRRYDFLESKSNGSTYDPLSLGLEKSRTNLGLSQQNTTGAGQDLTSCSKINTMERSKSFHGGFAPTPPSRLGDSSSIPTWRSRYHHPSITPVPSTSERPITGERGTGFTANTTVIPDRPGLGSATIHKPSSPLFNESSSFLPSKASDYTSSAGNALDYKSDFRPSRDLSDLDDPASTIAQTRPMYWLYGSRGRPNTPYKNSSYSYKSEEPLPSTYTSPSRMHESREVGFGDISRGSDYTRDLGSGLPRQNMFSTDTRSGDYSSKLAEYSPHQYSPSQFSGDSMGGHIRYDTNISQPPPPGSPAKRSILKKSSSYGGSSYSSQSGGQYYGGGGSSLLPGGDNPLSHLPPLSSGSSRKRVTFNHQQTYHPV